MSGSKSNYPYATIISAEVIIFLLDYWENYSQKKKRL
jgi:hypothetical protein